MAVYSYSASGCVCRVFCRVSGCVCRVSRAAEVFVGHVPLAPYCVSGASTQKSSRTPAQTKAEGAARCFFFLRRCDEGGGGGVGKTFCFFGEGVCWRGGGGEKDTELWLLYRVNEPLTVTLTVLQLKLVQVLSIINSYLLHLPPYLCLC